MRIRLKIFVLFITLAAPPLATAQVVLRDAIYLYNQDLYAGGQMQLGGENCDILQLIMDLDSGYTGLQMDQYSSSTDSRPSTYPDTIQNGAKMFSYMLFDAKTHKSFAFLDPNNPSGIGKIGTGTVFGYCLSSNATARVYLNDRINCVQKKSDNSTQAITGCSTTAGNSSAPRILNSSNQITVAQEVLASATHPVMSMEELVGAEYVDPRAAFGIAWSQMAKLADYMQQAKANNTLVGASEINTTACSAGGQVTVQVTDADNNSALSAGDSVTISANACKLSAGTSSGSVGYAFSSLSGDFNTYYYNAGLTMTLNDLQITRDQFSVRVNGSLTVAASANGVNSLKMTITSPVITTSGSYSGVTRTSSILNYRATKVTSSNAGISNRSYSLSGTLSSSQLSSQGIDFATTTPLVHKYSTDLYPSSGVMVITGTDNSRIKVSAFSSSQAKVELDTNGDGIYESSTLVGWNALMW